VLVEQKTAPATALSEAQRRRSRDLNGILTRTSWVPGEAMGLGDWVEHGRRLGVIGRGVGWWIGDWLRYGNMKWGERYVRASRITGYDVQTLMNMVYVATAYDASQRRHNLSFSHHAELAALPPEGRERWLDMAESNRLSVRCLREEMRRERRLGARDPAATEPADQVEPEGAEPAVRAIATTAEEEHALRCPHCGSKIAAPVPLPRRSGQRGRTRHGRAAASRAS
jgi:hypothetical protein